MKRAIILFACLLSLYFCKGQESSCINAELYNLVFKELNLHEKKAAKIKIGYKPNESTVDVIHKLKILDDDEIKRFQKSPMDIDYLNCNKLKIEVQSILSNDKIKEDGGYMGYVFSNLISISDYKKCILLHNFVGNTKYEGGKAIGDEVIFILEKKGDNWELTDKKSVGMY